VSITVLLMIDNYDSFTFNLVHYFESLGQSVEVARNDEISVATIEQLAPELLVISPGPCDPDKAGISLEVIKHFAGKIPILGVCLGHQAIAQHFGANVVKAKKVMHGKTSFIQHNKSGLFQALSYPLEVTRYHSLIVDKESLSNDFEITAWTSNPDGTMDEIMALKHHTLAIASVQFHPESVLTSQGHELLANFIREYTTNHNS